MCKLLPVSFLENENVNPNDLRYAKSFERPSTMVFGLLHWDKSEAFRWAPPWYDDTVLVYIDDMRLHSNYVLHTAENLEKLRIKFCKKHNINTKTFNDWNENPTIERPFKFSLHGKDDFSMGNAYATLVEAKEVLVHIKDEPTFEMLQLLDFRFTN